MSRHDFLQFNSYIKPGYDQMVNSTKHQLHTYNLKHLTFICSFSIISSIVLAIILVAVAILIWVKIYSYFSNMREVMDIIVQFSNEDIDKIKAYW
jgi:hypothetical protein